MWHPNVCAVDGMVRLCDILGRKWCPADTLVAIADGLVDLLEEPILSDLTCNEAAVVFKENRNEYFRRLKQMLHDQR